jgi:hypothetical protein
MDILHYYLEASEDTTWRNNFYQNAKNSDGKLFSFLNTNFRSITTFEYYFNQFIRWENVPRNEWELSESNGQEKIKQHVSNMISTFLFTSKRNSVGNLIYTLTEKGRVFQKLLDSDFSIDEKRILMLLIILNGSFDDIPKAALKTTSLAIDSLIENGINEEELMNHIKVFIKSNKNGGSAIEIFGYKALWLLTFYTDNDFIRLFLSEESTKLESLFELTKKDYQNNNKKNPLAWKYKNTNTTKKTTLDSFLIFYVSEIILKMRGNYNNLDSFIEFIIDSYNDIYEIDRKKVLNFVLNDVSNRKVFSVIMKSLLSESDDFSELPINDYKPRMLVQEIPTEKIDDTYETGLEKLEIVRTVLKNLAKRKSSYHCELHDLNQCRYFMSREDRNNYLEIHHFIPRQFSYAFEDSIEFVENYVPLCPHCHRMIHNAVDEQRRILINYLYSKRQSELNNKLANLELEKIYKFYGLEKN